MATDDQHITIRIKEYSEGEAKKFARDLKELCKALTLLRAPNPFPVDAHIEVDDRTNCGTLRTRP